MSPLHANAVALLAALAWGLGNVSQQTILQHLDGFAATGLTSIAGALVLVPVAVRESRQALPAPAEIWPAMIKIAVVFTAAATLMQFGYGHTTVTNAGFLVNTAAVLTPILVWIAYRQRPSVLVAVASLSAVLGIFLMAGIGVGTTIVKGDGLALLAAVGFALWTVVVSAHVVRFRRPALLTVVQLALCGAVCTGLGAVTYGWPDARAIAAALPEIAFLGIVSKGLAYFLMATAQQHVSATCAAIVVSAESIFGALAAAVLLGERVGLTGGLGAVFILIGVCIAARAPGNGIDRPIARHKAPDRVV